MSDIQMLEYPVEEVRKLREENKEMKWLLKTILQTDCLPHWAYEKGDDEESIVEMVKKFVKDD